MLKGYRAFVAADIPAITGYYSGTIGRLEGGFGVSVCTTVLAGYCSNPKLNTGAVSSFVPCHWQADF